MWILNERGVLAIACELTWSYPQNKRQKHKEIELKDHLLKALRRNNRKVLDLKHIKGRDMRQQSYTPITMPESKTNELCGPDKQLNAYQVRHTVHQD